MVKKRNNADDEPKKKRKREVDEEDHDEEDEKPKSNTTLILVGVGALLLCCCGAGGVGGGGFLFRDRLFVTKGIVEKDGPNKDAIARDARPGDKDKLNQPDDEWTASFKLTAADLAKEAINNSKAASDKYNGKLIEVTGTIRESERNTQFTIHGAKNPKDSSECIVFCNVYPSSLGDIIPSRKGQLVRVQGRVYKVEPTQVALRDAKVMFWDPVKKMLPEMTMNISVDEWVREWEKDTFAFNRNYGRKMAIVTGVVEGTSKTPANEVVVQFRSPSKTRVFVTFRDSINVSKGQNIQFRVTFQNFNANGGDFRILGDKFLK